MALTKKILTLISISTLLFSTIYAKENSSPIYDKFPSLGVIKSEAATPAKGANFVVKQLQAIETKIQRNRVDDLYLAGAPDVPEPKRKCCMKCGDIFQSAIAHAREGIALVNKPDLEKAKVEISAIPTDVDKCYSCFKESNIDHAEDKSLQEWVKGVTGDCLKNL